jgi:hypothetical protein
MSLCMADDGQAGTLVDSGLGADVPWVRTERRSLLVCAAWCGWCRSEWLECSHSDDTARHLLWMCSKRRLGYTSTRCVYMVKVCIY